MVCCPSMVQANLKYLIWRNKGMNWQWADWALVLDTYCQIMLCWQSYLFPLINSGKVFAPCCWFLTWDSAKGCYPPWARGEEEARSDVANLLETARTRVGMPKPCPVNWSALCARQGALLCCSFGSPFTSPCELLTSAQDTGSQDQNNKGMNEHTAPAHSP